MKYRAVYLCNYDDTYLGEGCFVTQKEAWEYVYTKCCEWCRSVDNGRGSQCAAEWMVDEMD